MSQEKCNKGDVWSLKLSIRYGHLQEVHYMEIPESIVDNQEVLSFMAQGLLFDLGWSSGYDSPSWKWEIVKR